MIQEILSPAIENGDVLINNASNKPPFEAPFGMYAKSFDVDEKIKITPKNIPAGKIRCIQVTTKATGNGGYSIEPDGSILVNGTEADDTFNVLIIYDI